MAPRYLHLVTVGTSLLRNAWNHARRVGDQEAAEALTPCADPRSFNDLECEKRLTPGSRPWDFVEAFLAGDPFNASAEVNAMRHFIDYEDGSCRTRLLDRVVLYHSDTHAGWAAAKMLDDFFTTACKVESELTRIPGLGNLEKFWEGIAYLTKHVICTSMRASREGYIVLANATGGFKPETGALILAAAVGGVSGVYYIHEAGREPVYIPVIPVVPRERAGETLSKLLTAYAMDAEARGREWVEVTDEDFRKYPWLLRVAASMGLAREVAPGRFRFRVDRLQQLARYVEWLLSPDC